MQKPSLFIGSSSEGLEFARAVRFLLVGDAEVTLWNESVFEVGATFIESLVNALPRFDFAALLLTPDDLVTSRSVEGFGPRDNVLFELGLFMGRLGRSRTFMIRPRTMNVKVPTDLSGVTAALYDWPRLDGDYRAAVGPACDSIRPAIRSLGLLEARVAGRLQAVQAEQQRQKEEIDALAFIVAHFVSNFEYEHLERLDSGNAFPFEMHPGFERELRHLWAELRFITKKHEFKIAEMPRTGDLREFFDLSSQGRMYLRLRHSDRGHRVQTDF